MYFKVEYNEKSLIFSRYFKLYNLFIYYYHDSFTVIIITKTLIIIILL